MPLKIHTTWNGRLYVEDEDLYESSEVTDKIRKLGNRIPSRGNPDGNQHDTEEARGQAAGKGNE